MSESSSKGIFSTTRRRKGTVPIPCWDDSCTVAPGVAVQLPPQRGVKLPTQRGVKLPTQRGVPAPKNEPVPVRPTVPMRPSGQ